MDWRYGLCPLGRPCCDYKRIGPDSQRLCVQEAPSHGFAAVALRVLLLSYPGEVRGNLMPPIVHNPDSPITLLLDCLASPCSMYLEVEELAAFTLTDSWGAGMGGGDMGRQGHAAK